MPFPKTNRANKARQPQHGIKIDDKLILPLIYKHRGNISRIADALGCVRHTIYDHCQKNPELKTALEQARERVIDELEESVEDRALHGTDTTLQIFLLKTRGRHRGYEQSEAQHMAKDIATAAFDFILDKSKNPVNVTNPSTLSPQGDVSQA